MADTPTALLEIGFETPNGRSISARDLGQDFISAKHSVAGPEDPVLIRVGAQESKAGNLFYSWDLNGIKLPDGFATRLVVNGVALKVGLVKESKKGNQMRQDEGEIVVTSVPYKVSGLIVRTRKPYWVKVVAHRKPGRPRRT